MKDRDTGDYPGLPNNPTLVLTRWKKAEESERDAVAEAEVRGVQLQTGKGP